MNPKDCGGPLTFHKTITALNGSFVKYLDLNILMANIRFIFIFKNKISKANN